MHCYRHDLKFGIVYYCKNFYFKFGINETLKLQETETVVDGQADTLVEAMCPLRSIRKRRSTSNENSSEFVFGYQVSISNDGIHFANETVNVYIFDSTCQYKENMTGSGLRFHLKVCKKKSIYR